MPDVEPLWPTDKFKNAFDRDGYYGLTTDGLSYFISEELVIQGTEIIANNIVQITEYLKSRRGETNVQILTSNIGEISKFPVPSTIEKMNLALRWISTASNNTTNTIEIYTAYDQAKLYQLMRDISVSNLSDVNAIIKNLDLRGLASVTTGHGWAKGSMTIDGLIHLENQEKDRRISNTCFVAMWFSDEMSDVYNNGILPAIIANGYTPVRIDRVEHNNKIDDEIVASIRRSKFVVADFSCGNDGARGGVYFEAGFAHGLDIPVIFCVRDTDLSRVHFDTRQFSHIVWDDADDLKKKLAIRIAATIT